MEISRRSFLVGAGAAAAAASGAFPCAAAPLTPARFVPIIGFRPDAIAISADIFGSGRTSTFADFGWSLSRDTLEPDPSIKLNARQIADQVKVISRMMLLEKAGRDPKAPAEQEALLARMMQATECSHHSEDGFIVQGLYQDAAQAVEYYAHSAERRFAGIKRLEEQYVPETRYNSLREPVIGASFTDNSVYVSFNEEYLPFKDMFELVGWRFNGIRPGIFTCSDDVEAILNHPLLHWCTYKNPGKVPFNQTYPPEQIAQFKKFEDLFARLEKENADVYDRRRSMGAGIEHNSLIAATTPETIEKLWLQRIATARHELAEMGRRIAMSYKNEQQKGAAGSSAPLPTPKSNALHVPISELLARIDAGEALRTGERLVRTAEAFEEVLNALAPPAAKEPQPAIEEPKKLTQGLTLG